MGIINGIGADQQVKTTSDVLFNTVTESGGYPKSTITGATVLTSDDFGTQVVCTSSPAYAVTLPSVTSNNGKYIDFFINTASNALVTITPASGVIQGQSTFILGSGESCRVYCDGTNWWVQNLMLTPLSFFITRNNVVQVIPDSTNTKIQFTTESYDIGGFFDNVTNYRYTPLYPGKYCFYLSARYETTANSCITQSLIFQNGVHLSTNTNNNIAAGTPVSDTNFIVLDMNGSTDYVEFYTVHNAGAPKNLLGTVEYTYAGGYRVSNF